jgi:hypothetical protein
MMKNTKESSDLSLPPEIYGKKLGWLDEFYGGMHKRASEDLRIIKEIQEKEKSAKHSAVG